MGVCKESYKEDAMEKVISNLYNAIQNWWEVHVLHSENLVNWTAQFEKHFFKPERIQDLEFWHLYRWSSTGYWSRTGTGAKIRADSNKERQNLLKPSHIQCRHLHLHIPGFTFPSIGLPNKTSVLQFLQFNSQFLKSKFFDFGIWFQKNIHTEWNYIF